MGRVRMTKEQLIEELDLLRQRIAELEAKKAGENFDRNALHDNLQLYQTIFESANDAIFIMDMNTYIECNNTTLKIFGCKDKSDIIGCPPWEFSPPRQPDGKNSKEKAISLMQSALQGKPHRFRWKHTRKDGTLFDADVALNRLEAGGKAIVLAIVRDITEKVKSEIVLRESQELIQAQFNHSPAIILIVDESHKVLRINRPILGSDTAEELIGRDAVGLLPPEHQEEARKALNQCFTTAESQEIEHSISGGRWVRGHISPILEQGKVTKAIITSIDITDRKRAKEALKESEHYLSKAQSIAHIGHWSMDAETNDGYGSDELYRIFGLNRSKASRDIFLEVVHPDDREYDLYHLERAIKHGDGWNIEYRLVCKDGTEKTVQSIGEAIVDKTGKTIRLVGTIQDITDRKRAEERLKESAKELRDEREILSEKNIALKQILNHMEQEKTDYKHEISASIDNLIMPIVDKLRKNDGNLGGKDIDIFEENLISILGKEMDQFKNNYNKLTPRELDVCEKLKLGLTTKEIANALHISDQTIEKHRTSIRRKLQIKHKNINLAAFLRSK